MYKLYVYILGECVCVSVYRKSPNCKQPKYPSTVKQKTSWTICTSTEMRTNYMTFNIDEPIKVNIEQKKVDPKSAYSTLYSYVKFKNKKTHYWFQKSHQWLPWGDRLWKGLHKGFLGAMAKFHFLVCVLVTWVYLLCER
jgi:hypothetical protein